MNDMSGPLLLPDVPDEVPPGGLSIGETAALTGVGVETLRYYEREGLLLDPAPRDARRRLPRFQPEAFAANRALVERVERIAADKGVTVAQVALAWLLGEGVVPIPGTRHRARLDENAAAAHITLSRDERRRLTEALPASEIAGGRDFAPWPRAPTAELRPSARGLRGRAVGAYRARRIHSS